jgi:glc operon protein GlcG
VTFDRPEENEIMTALRRIATLSILSAAIAGAAQAQVVEKKSLTLDAARKLIAAAVAEAGRLEAPGGVIAIVDDGGNLMCLERLDGTFAAGANISIGKARTAVMFKRPTRVFEEIIKNGRTAMVALPEFTPLQGGVPIEIDGQIVGGVGVSGAASAQQDEALAIAGANAVKSLGTSAVQSAASASVTYFDSRQVAAAFNRGAVLVDGGEGRNYMVHASHRDGPGMAEVHTRDTDILYVLEGSATIVTGGAVVDGKSTAADEIRGTAIRGGESRRLSKGDVMVVPSGTPHWFQEVKGPLHYYVVKVR